MGAILAIMMKDIRLLLRDRMGFFFAFGFPILISIFFGTIFGGGGSGSGSSDSAKIDILLVDEDQTDGSRAFGKTLAGASEFKITPSPSRQEASDAVRRGKSTAFIALPKGFGKSREQMFFGSGSSIVLGVDPSRSAEAGMLEGLLTKYGFMQMQDGFRDPEVMRKQVRSSLDALKGSAAMGDSDKRVFEKFFGDLDQFLVDVPRESKPADPGATPKPDAAPSDAGTASTGGWQPIRIEKADVVVTKKEQDGPAVKNSYAWTFPQGMIWGFIGCAMSFAVALVLERSRGTMLRLRVAPLCPMQILTGKALACFVMTQIVGWLLVALAYFVFDVRPTSWPTLAVAMLCTSNCFVGIMLLTSVLSQSERAAAGLGWGVMLIFSMIGGGMIPLFIMKGWMQTLSMFSPVRWSILALEGGIWRNMSPSEMLLPCGILLGIGMAGYWAATWAFGKTES